MTKHFPLLKALVSAASAAALVCAMALWAQDAQQAPPPDQNMDQSPAQDPPSRVARLDMIQGQVSFQPATVNEWTAATLNYPVTIGDHVYADQDSRAALHIGSTAIRLGSTSGVSFLNLDDHIVQFRLDEGAVVVSLKNVASDEGYEIDTPQGAVSLIGPGEYRVDTDPDRNATMVTVRSGQAQVNYSGGAIDVQPQQTAYFAGDNQQPQVAAANPPDALDQVSEQQEQQDAALPPPRYVSQDMPGWQDLERNGEWQVTPDYGPVWRPRTVVAEWAPYRYGHWAWIDPWGWTWIDDAQWGFAPFHYGRWAMVGGGWAWVPGPVAPRPVYAPALVAFVGGLEIGAALSGGGAVAWFPLGPREVFVPSYHVSRVYVSRVNVVNVTNVTVVNRVYVNQTAGITAVDHRTFVGAAPVSRSVIRVPRDVAVRGRVTTMAAVAPEHTSVLGRAGAPRNVPHPPERVMQRQVYAQRPPAPAPLSFSARQQALQANPGRPVDPRTVNQLRTQAPAREPAVRTLPQRQPSYPQGNQPGNTGGTRFGRQEPTHQTPQTPTNPQRPRFDRTTPPPTTETPQQRNRPEVTRPVTPSPEEQQRRTRPEVTRPVPPQTTTPQTVQPRVRPERPVTPPAEQPQPRQRPQVQQPPQQERPAAQTPRHEERPAPKPAETKKKPVNKDQQEK